jgi:hypothetical protein
MEMIVANPHLAHVDTRLHRPTVMPDEASAPEGGYIHPHDWRSHRGRVGQPPASDAEKVAGVLLAVSIGLVGACALVAWWTT